MKQIHVAVPQQTAEQVKEISETIRRESGLFESNGTIVAKAVAEYHKKKVGK